MATNQYYYDEPSLSIDKQMMNMKAAVGGFRKVFRRHDEVTWEGFLQPTPASKSYRVRIQYKLNDMPKVTLPDETLLENTPHTYGGVRLCIYHWDGIGAWRPDLPISHHLVPMIAHWLWCYEFWQITGRWPGEEYPHGDRPKEEG
jgi:hypothetical protein